VPSPFEHLRDFILTRMRMSHIYQPVMIKELIQSGGRASIRNIVHHQRSLDRTGGLNKGEGRAKSGGWAHSRLLR
jgi:hypothetical protein